MFTELSATMTDTFLAQCPSCHASFRLQHSQLTAARGSVRCGACLKVFNATKQMDSELLHSDDPVLSENAGFESLAALNDETVDSIHTAPASQPKPTASHDPFAKLDLNAELARLEREEQLSRNVPQQQQ